MLNNFVANLFKKICTNFHQNQPSFVGDIMIKTFWSFFLAEHTVHFDKEIHFFVLSISESGMLQNMVYMLHVQCFDSDIHIICFANINAVTYGVAGIYYFDVCENFGYGCSSCCIYRLRNKYSTHTPYTMLHFRDDKL